MTIERRIVAKGVSLAIRESGDSSAPTVVLVHGYPDTASVWDEIVERLQGRYHVVAYDVRGAGASDTPRGPRGFALERLAEDLVAVIEATSPGRPAHVVGHDWGSLIGWEAATTPNPATRIASFTSISGPSLDHVGEWIRARLDKPSMRGARELAGQGIRSWYSYLLATPGLGFLLARVLARRFAEFLRRAEGVAPRPGHPAPTITRDSVNGLALYRTNMRRRVREPRPPSTDVPVQVVVPTRDFYVSPALSDGLERRVSHLWRRRVRAKHWVVRSHPDVVARMIGEFVDHIEGAAPARSLRRARAGARRSFEDHLVVVTGAGSGIGRATALAFAERGAEVVVADIDAEAAHRTSGLAALIGPGGHAFEVDVSDRDAMERFSKGVVHDLGVPDVVVNNAGIGLAGPFLRTEFDDWRRILDVNLWGVIHGSLLFGREMADRGEGGHIVNVASAAAYLPSRALPAYSTSKAAVLMLSECMRGELSDTGIGVSAICPGLINTNIVRTARFVGLGEEEQRRRRRTALRIYGLRNYTPDRVALAVVRAVRSNVAVVPVSPEATAGRILSRISPGIVRALGGIDGDAWLRRRAR